MADAKSTTGPAAAAAPTGKQDQGAGQPAKTGEAKTTQPAVTAKDVPLRGSPGGVYRMVNGQRVRAQD